MTLEKTSVESVCQHPVAPLSNLPNRQMLVLFHPLLNLAFPLNSKHPDTVESFMKSRRTLHGKLEKSKTYPSMLSVTDGKYFQEQIEAEKKKAEVDFLQKFTEKPNEYTEAQNG